LSELESFSKKHKNTLNITQDRIVTVEQFKYF
jgi:hypothetical protein